MFSKLCFALSLSVSLAFGAGMFQSVEPDKATLVNTKQGGEYCMNCGMNLPKFYKTNHIHKDTQYCSLHCLYEATRGNLPSEAKVVDTKNLNFIDAYKATYVIGSSMKGTMSQNSKYAFSSIEDAKEFQAQNGGSIANFEEAFEVAKKDFLSDKKMIKAKREGGVYEKGKTVYETKCQKVNAKEFKNIASLKANLKEVCSTKNDAELQAAALYIWDTPKAKEQKTISKIIVPKDAKCPVCGMFVAKNPSWVAMINDGDKELYFDGVKDMMKFIFKENKKFNQIFVTNYYKLQKIDAKTAIYVIGSDVYGPMGSELIPFSTIEEARTFAKDHDGKTILSFDEITKSLVEKL
ncbi:NosL family protein [Campylobacter iguaniorum]|uniref:nitrous oxide reductase accessory protein NosL n=1 Tax=Campylobacter iguaniorum TaxID=1244531 RepID=UPI00073A3CA6|nr:nitrous oxide reductase accessory protein NosL [Campylobacter iguaniorum]ALV24619.1 NosL family protein [Campylobacter iguaniorum]